MATDLSDAPSFTFAQVESILAATFVIAPTKRRTFMARLQQLQRLGLPRGTNVGRSSRARYEYWQLAELALYLDLLDCGISPAVLKTHFGDNPHYTTNGAPLLSARAAGDGRAAGGPYLLPRFHALGHLQSDSAARTSTATGDHEILTRPADALAEAISEHPSPAIDLSARLHRLADAIVEQLADGDARAGAEAAA